MRANVARLGAAKVGRFMTTPNLPAESSAGPRRLGAAGTAPAE
jgi:hypothetical protein